jgi:hypothetical protein
MIRTLLRFARAGLGVFASAAPSDEQPLKALQGNGSSSFDKLNILSLLAQAGYAFQKGNAKRGALLLGAATIAPKNKEASYLIQGVLTLDSVRKRLS